VRDRQTGTLAVERILQAVAQFKGEFSLQCLQLAIGWLRESTV